MEILGTHFALTLGSWRLRFVLSIEETEETRVPTRTGPHHLTVVKDPGNARGARR
jgi:hypothetical protein